MARVIRVEELHGPASSRYKFDLIAEPLTLLYRVFAIDQCGHALSDKSTNGYDFETLARDLDQVAESPGNTDLPITLIGHSWNAYTARYYAATRPARTTKVMPICNNVSTTGKAQDFALKRKHWR